MMKVTSAVANKMIREYTSDIEYLRKLEGDAAFYKVVEGVVPYVPEYSFEDTQQKIMELNNKILKIRHALNKFNCETVLSDVSLTIDEALIKMAQLSKMKDKLNVMRSSQSKVLDRSYDSDGTRYTCTNYSPKAADEYYRTMCDDIRDIQVALDIINNTVQFDIPID